MTKIVKIGNSRGVRIPKKIIEQTHLEDVELEILVQKDGLLLKPVKKHRELWDKQIENALKNANQDDSELDEWLDLDVSL